MANISLLLRENSALSAQVNELNLNFDKWNDVLHNTNTATNMDFKPMNNALTRYELYHVNLCNLSSTPDFVNYSNGHKNL